MDERRCSNLIMAAKQAASMCDPSRPMTFMTTADYDPEEVRVADETLNRETDGMVRVMKVHSFTINKTTMGDET